MPKSNPDISDLSADEAMLESRLLSVSPAAINLNRDELMYQAGRRAARQSTSRWKALSGCLAAGLVLSLVLHIPNTTHLARSTDGLAPTQPTGTVQDPLQLASQPQGNRMVDFLGATGRGTPRPVPLGYGKTQVSEYGDLWHPDSRMNMRLPWD